MKRTQSFFRGMLPRFFSALFLFFWYAALSSSPLFAQSVTKTDRSSDGAGAIVFDTSKLPEFKGDKAVSLLDYHFGDNQVEFKAQGYWQSTISGSASYSFGFGTTPGFSFSAPVFAQKVDLSLWFMLNKHWYFEAGFADQFTKNTVAAGYRGEGLVKSVRVSNRGIVFPSLYSVDEVSRGIGGGENQAPGVSAALGGENWQAHFAARYDMLKSEEKTWYGKNSVSTTTVSLSNFVTGIQFVLPDSDVVSSVKDVYVENSSGSYRDGSGRRYKKLDASQYLLLPRSYTVLVAKDAGASKRDGALPAVAFSFSGMAASSVATKSDAMISDVKKWFREGGVDVEQFFFSVSSSPSSERFVAPIDGEDVLFVQHPSGFSPFTVCYRYDAGITSATEGAIASRQTEVNSTEFGVLLGNDTLHFVMKDFFSLDHAYADVYRADVSSDDMRKPEVRFPFAATDAAVYLGYEQKTDFELKIRTYTAVSRFDIGTDAVPGTVRVYKNGILDGGATYDSNSGTVTLSTAVSPSDHIHAVWYKDSAAADSGAFAGAAGFVIQPKDRLSADVSVSSRWTYAGGRKFADADYAAPGFVTLASKISYGGEHLSLSNTVAASVESENTTGKYRILGMDDKKRDTVYLAKNAAVDIPSGFAPVLSERSHGSKVMPSSLGENRSDAAQEGHEDESISGYAVPVSWEKLSDSGKTRDFEWAGIALRLPGNAGNLASATSFSIALKNQNLKKAGMKTPDNFSVYLQLGVQAENDAGKLSLEKSSTVPTWLVSKTTSSDENPSDVRKAFVLSEYPEKTGGWQTISVTLSDADRSRLALYPHGRIVICAKEDVDPGEILVGPYQAEGAGFSLTYNAVTAVSTVQERDGTLSSSEVKELNKGTNYVQQFDWRVYDTSSLTASDSFTVIADHYFKEVDLENYGMLSLWFKYAPKDKKTIPDSCKADYDETALVFLLDRPDENGLFKEAVKISVPGDAAGGGEAWHYLSVDLNRETVMIDGAEKGSVRLNTSVIPVRFRILMNTADAAEKKYYETGTLCVDELHLSESSPYVVLQDKAKVEWKQNGVVLGKNGYAILKDVRLSVTGAGNATLRTGENGKNKGAVSSTAQAAFTLTKLRVALDAAFSSDSRSPLSSASHAIQTAEPLGKVLRFSENYGFSAGEKSLEKENSVGIDFTEWGVPVFLKGETSARSNSWAMSQKSAAELGTNFALTEWRVKAGVEQKRVPSSGSVLATDSYGQGWVEIGKLAFDMGNPSASRRNVNGETSFLIRLPWAAFSPKVTAKTAGLYASTSRQTFSGDSSLELLFPFSFGMHHFSVSWKKSGGGVRLSSKGGDYGRDMGDLRSSYDDVRWFLTAFPVYDLVSSGLSESVLSDTTMHADSAESLYYGGLYEASWKRGFYGNKKDLILPSSVVFSVSRDIRTAATTADVYQLKTTVGYTALNMFGEAGIIPLATWFEQDEYALSLSYACKIPRASPQAYTMLVSGYVQANFFMGADNSIKTGAEGSFENADNWSGKLTVMWKRGSSFSPVVSLFALFRPGYDTKSAALTRTDSLNLGSSRSKSTTADSATQKYNAAYNHDLDIVVNRFFTVHTQVGGTYACTWDKIVTVTAVLTLGGSLKF